MRKAIENLMWQKNWLGFFLRKAYQTFYLPISCIEKQRELYRSIDPTWVDEDGQISSMAFRTSGGISCFLADFTSAETARIGDPITRKKFGLLSFRAWKINFLGLAVRHDPFTTPKRFYAHCQIYNHMTQEYPKLTKGESKALIKKSVKIRMPEK